METSRGLGKIRGIGGAARLLAALAAFMLLAGCVMPSKTDSEELRQEIKGLKEEVAALKERVGQLEAQQKALADQLKKMEAAKEPLLPTEKPGEAGPLSVAQLVKDKDRYLGARVTVKGPVLTVLVHHKSLLLASPEGMVEVFFGNLPDKKQVDRLTSTPLEHPITVTGVVSAPANKAGPKLRIIAEAVES
jgi:outer membrane murein-binding lipoprotein Lpp